MDPTSKEELQTVLHSFKKDKSPITGRWTIEFFTRFYELIEEDLLRVVEECLITGRILRAFNITFSILILKKDKHESFDEFKTISLCNCVNKIIAKS